MRFGAIVRSFGERTEQLCIASVSNCLSEKNVHIIQNVAPFSKVVEAMILIATENEYDWYIGIDADTVLIFNWLSMINAFLKQTKDIDSYYKIDFQLQDKFVKQCYIYGLHLYNGEYNQQMLNILKSTKTSSKPEGNIRHKINAKFINSTSGYIGYHGYEQYYKDIYNRFAIRSFRNREDIKRYKLFETKDCDNFIGKKGWVYGLKNKKTVLNLLDARNKILIEQTGYVEKSFLKMSLMEFYKNVVL